ncbi:hypothetical protein FQN55_000613 [Onygenales sp. PD_40]|nr:hypothetical protein FQN55_000613 [Onygenales sp. PD_40]
MPSQLARKPASASPSPEPDDGRTSLHQAALEGQYDALKQLLDQGASPTATDLDKRTPLHLAAKRMHNTCVELLVVPNTVSDDYSKTEATADEAWELLPSVKDAFELQDVYGFTPLHLAIIAAEWGARDRAETTIKLLLEGGADPNSKIHSGRSIWRDAVDTKEEWLLDLLKEHGVEEEDAEPEEALLCPTTQTEHHREMREKYLKVIRKVTSKTLWETDEPLEIRMYMEGYEAVYQLESWLDFNEDKTPKDDDEYFPGKEVYYNLSARMNRHVSDIMATMDHVPEEEVLAFYVREWTRYKALGKKLDNIHQSIQRHAIRCLHDHENGTGKRTLDISQVIFTPWKEGFLKPGSRYSPIPALIPGQSEYIEVRDRSLVKQVTASYSFLNTKVGVKVAQEVVETAHLNSTASRYLAMAKDMAQNLPIEKYIQVAHKHLTGEFTLAGASLLPQTQIALKQTTYYILITSKIPTYLLPNFHHLLSTAMAGATYDNDPSLENNTMRLKPGRKRNPQAYPLTILHTILTLNPSPDTDDVFAPFRAEYRSLAKEAYMRKLAEMMGLYDRISEEEERKKKEEEETALDGLLDIHLRYKAVVEDGFGGDEGVLRALEEVYEEVRGRVAGVEANGGDKWEIVSGVEGMGLS